MNYLTYIDYNTYRVNNTQNHLTQKTNEKKQTGTVYNPTENQTQNGLRIHEKSKQINTKVETSDSCFG